MVGSVAVSSIGLGCNSFGTTYTTRVDLAGTRAVIDAAIDQGITLLDTADVYGDSEEFLGQVLQGRRDSVVIATKFGGRMGSDDHKGASARWIAAAVEDSLRRLQTDRIDLYQLHFPDPTTPIEETLGALDRLVRDGKVREIGCSNFSAEQIDEAASIAADGGLHPFVSAQNELSLLRARAAQDVAPACVRHGMGLLPYSPLSNGLLTGKYQAGSPPPEGTRLASLPAEVQTRSLSDRTFARLDALDGFAKAHDRSLLDLAMAWLLAVPSVASVIAGATRPEQVAANVAAGSWRLTPAEADEAAALAR
jgi:aryl-alcohol dehydrogenase-like predicted oxidoreductase